MALPKASRCSTAVRTIFAGPRQRASSRPRPDYRLVGYVTCTRFKPCLESLYRKGFRTAGKFDAPNDEPIHSHLPHQFFHQVKCMLKTF